MQHTKEPWSNDGNGIHVGHQCVALTYMNPKGQRDADARRIVACVNACAGYSTEALEEPGGFMKSLGDALAREKELTEQRDELLALVKRYRKETPLGHQPHMIAHLADEAIAKAEQ